MDGITYDKWREWNTAFTSPQFYKTCTIVCISVDACTVCVCVDHIRICVYQRTNTRWWFSLEKEKSVLYLWWTDSNNYRPSKKESKTRPTRTYIHTYVLVCTCQRLIDNMSEGTLSITYCLYRMFRRCRMRFQPQTLWQIGNRCRQERAETKTYNLSGIHSHVILFD